MKLLSVFILVSSPRFLITAFSLYPHPSRRIKPTQGYENREQGLLIWSKRTGFFVVYHCLYPRKPGNATFRRNKKTRERKVLDYFAQSHARTGRASDAPTYASLYDDVQRWFRSPGQHIPQSDDIFNRSRPVLVRNHVYAIAVQLQ